MRRARTVVLYFAFYYALYEVVVLLFYGRWFVGGSNHMYVR